MDLQGRMKTLDSLLILGKKFQALLILSPSEEDFSDMKAKFCVKSIGHILLGH